MLTNKRFELKHSTLAIDAVGKRVGWITIPTGAIIRVVAGPNRERDLMVDVRWEERHLVMFAIDLTAGATEIKSKCVEPLFPERRAFMQYLLTLPMMVSAFKDNHQSAVTIPAGTIIEVVGPVEDDDRFLLIQADDVQFHIFVFGSCGPGKTG